MCGNCGCGRDFNVDVDQASYNPDPEGGAHAALDAALAEAFARGFSEGAAVANSSTLGLRQAEAAADEDAFGSVDDWVLTYEKTEPVHDFSDADAVALDNLILKFEQLVARVELFEQVMGVKYGGNKYLGTGHGDEAPPAPGL